MQMIGEGKNTVFLNAFLYVRNIQFYIFKYLSQCAESLPFSPSNSFSIHLYLTVCPRKLTFDRALSGSLMLYCMVKLDQWEMWEGNQKVMEE